MGDKYRLDYYYGTESEQFSFFRIPKMLFTDKRFRKLSCDAIVLYSMMLDRMSLSRKNGWFDDKNRAYIYYSVEDAMEDLDRSRPTAIKVIKELDTDTGIGLIERHKPGQGKPTVIYVKNFAKAIDPADPVKEPSSEDSEDSVGSSSKDEKEAEVKVYDFQKSNIFTAGSKESELLEVKDPDFRESKSFTSESKNSELPEVKNPDPNNTKINYININNTENNDTEGNKSYPSIYQNPGEEMAPAPGKDIDVIDFDDPIQMERAYTWFFRRNVGYPDLLRMYPYDRERIDELIRIMVKVRCFGKEPYNIGGCSVPAKLVGAQFQKLKNEHIQYVLDSLKKTNVPMKAPEAYIVSALYSAYNTFSNELNQRVNYDMYGGGWKEKGVV